MAQPRHLVPIAEARQHRPWATKRYLQTLIWSKRLPHHKMGDSPRSPVFVNLDDLDEFAARHRVEAERAATG